jgi:hypothetical protein
MNLFDAADLIHSHSRATMLEDGDLVELDPKLCREAGFVHPIAVTRAVYAKVIAMTPAAKRACNDVEGRTWDVLTMARHGLRRVSGGSSVAPFQVLAVVDRVRPTLVGLKIVCGPGDDAEPVLTILLPNED